MLDIFRDAKIVKNWGTDSGINQTVGENQVKRVTKQTPIC